ncbi:3-oxoacyl-ACP synthase, partial [Streptomyces sp. NPDC059083]
MADRALGYLTGIGEAGIAYRNDRPARELAALAAARALQDAGLGPEDIDGVAVSKTSDLLPSDKPASDLADYLGIRA